MDASIHRLADPSRFEAKLFCSARELKAFMTMLQNGLGLCEEKEIVDATNVYNSIALAVVKEAPLGLDHDPMHSDTEEEDED